MVHPEGNSGQRKTRSWSEIVYVYQRNNFRESRLLHLPINRKALKSLTWDICFCHKRSFDAWLFFFFFQQKLLYILTPPLSLGTVLQHYSRGWFPGYSPLKKIKLSAFRLCVCFFFLIDNYCTICVCLTMMLHLYRVDPAPRGFGCQD